MTRVVELTGARSRPAGQMSRLFADGWPAFITADREVKKHLGRAGRMFPDLDLVLLDDGNLVASGWAVPILWNGYPTGLPGGYTAALGLAVKAHKIGTEPNALAIMAAQIRPDRRGQGLAGEVLLALRGLARDRGWTQVLAPVRPTLKSRYPLTSIEQFGSWTRQDGTSLDPWIRTHQRVGAHILAPAPRSQVMTGTVAEWEAWTGMVFLDPGQYVIPYGLSTVMIDRDNDIGTYVEPNIWMQHPANAAAPSTPPEPTA